MSNFKSSLINDLAVAKLGQPGGFAKLDENGLVTLDQLPGGSVVDSPTWVPQSFTPNPMNPFSSGPPQKLDGNGNPNVYHFNSSGPVSTDGTTVFAVQQDERLWYRIDTDSWYHEKNTPQYLGASVFSAGTAGIVPLAQQGQQNFVFKGDGNWGGAWGNLNTSGGPIPDGKYLIDAATVIALTLDEAIGEVRLFDYKGLAATNNITVGTNAQTFTDASGTAVVGPYVINTNNEDITFVNNTGTNAFTVVKRVSVTNPTVAEYGEQVLGSNITVPTTSTSPTVATDILSFTLPSAGTWDVDFIVRGGTFSVTTSGANGMAVVITNNSNAVISNTELKVGRESFASVDALNFDLQFSATGKAQITTTGATTYKVRGYHDGSGGSTGSWTAQSDNNGRTKVSWNKIAGQLPATMPTTVNGGIAFGNGTQLIQDAPNLFYNNVSKRLGIGTSSPSSNLTIQDGNASVRLNETVNNQNLWFNRFTNRTVMASSDQIEIRTGSADGVNGALTTIDNSGNITQFGATKITTGTNGLRLPITSASANVAGGAIGVDVNGDVVKIGNPTIPTLVGSNGVIAGTAGLVPAPTATDNTKFLKGDGTWATAGSATVPFVNGGIVFGNGTAQVQDSNNFFVDNTNKRVGLGTNIPTERLDIVGSGAGGSSAVKISKFGGGAGWGIKLVPLNNGGDYIRFDRADGNQIGRINNSGATGDDFGLAAQGDLILGSSYVDRLRITSNGYIGIGTSTPIAVLDVSSGTNEVLKLNGPKTTLKINSNNDNPELVFSRSGGVVGNFGQVNFKFDNTGAGGTLNNVFNFEGGLKIPITSSTPDATGSPIGVNGNGEIVKIANTAAAVLGAYAQGQWYQQGNNVLLASANWVPISGYTIQGITLTTATGASPKWTVNETGTYMIQTGVSCQPLADDVLTGMTIIKNLGEIVAANHFLAKGLSWQQPITTVGIEIDMVAGDTFEIVYANVKIMDGGGPETTKIKRVR